MVTPLPTESFRNVTKAVEVGAHSDSASSREERRSAGRGQAELGAGPAAWGRNGWENGQNDGGK